MRVLSCVNSGATGLNRGHLEQDFLQRWTCRTRRLPHHWLAYSALEEPQSEWGGWRKRLRYSKVEDDQIGGAKANSAQDGSTRFIIIYNEKEITVTENLYDFLSHCSRSQDPHFQSHVRIDAICINHILINPDPHLGSLRFTPHVSKVFRFTHLASWIGQYPLPCF